MGHGHTPEEQRGEGGVCGVDGGFAAPHGERVSSAPRSRGVRLALGALRFYKAYLSLLVGGSCRFEPTCSMYAYAAVERFGVARGSWLTLKRLLRCHPLSRRFGYDPVPEAWREAQHNRATPNEAHW
jgi:putative membrane protein insertion efficiency factor